MRGGDLRGRDRERARRDMTRSVALLWGFGILCASKRSWLFFEQGGH